MRRSPVQPTTSDRPSRVGLAALALGLSLALPAAAAERPAERQAANWTVFLATGSTMQAAGVHHDEEAGRWRITLPSGGTIMLSETAVKRVSHDVDDRVEKAAPVVAASGDAPRPGPAPGSLDTSAVRPEPLKQVAVKPDGETMKTRAAARAASLGALRGDARVRSAREQQLTPRPGRMEQVLRRANSRPVAPANR
jgi:hypothetical protein